MENVSIKVNGKEYISAEFVSKELFSAAEILADLCERKVHDKEIISVSNAFQFLSEILKQFEPEDYNDKIDFGCYLAQQALDDFLDLDPDKKLITK